MDGGRDGGGCGGVLCRWGGGLGEVGGFDRGGGLTGVAQGAGGEFQNEGCFRGAKVGEAGVKVRWGLGRSGDDNTMEAFFVIFGHFFTFGEVHDGGRQGGVVGEFDCMFAFVKGVLNVGLEVGEKLLGE